MIFLFKLDNLLQATGMTPLMYVVKDNRSSFVDRMIELGSDVGARNNVSKMEIYTFINYVGH